MLECDVSCHALGFLIPYRMEYIHTVCVCQKSFPLIYIPIPDITVSCFLPSTTKSYTNVYTCDIVISLMCALYVVIVGDTKFKDYSYVQNALCILYCCLYLSTMMGSEGVSFLLPHDRCSRHLLQINSCVSRTRRKSGFLHVPS